MKNSNNAQPLINTKPPVRAIDRMTDNLPQEGLSGRQIIYDEDGKPYVKLCKTTQDLLVQSSV